MAVVRRGLQPAGVLGVEAGGTRTTALWVPDPDDSARSGRESDSTGAGTSGLQVFGPGNLQLLDDPALVSLFRTIARRFPLPRAVGIGMAGARTDRDRDRIRAAAAEVWRRAPCLATHDLEIALAAAGPLPRGSARVLVLSGTGSCSYGRIGDGQCARAGGWGHVLGDQGSGYSIGLAGMRAAVEAFDLEGAWGRLGQSLLAALHLTEPDALVPWAASATKAEVAALAPLVFAAAQARDILARGVVAQAAADLGRAAVACAGRLTGGEQPVDFVFAGSVLLGQRSFANAVGRHIRQSRPAAVLRRLETPGAAGAVRLAREWIASSPKPPLPKDSSPRSTVFQERPSRSIPTSSALSPTEERNPRSRNLDRLGPGAAIELMLSEDERLPGALRAERAQLVRALGLVSRALRSGGRLFYVGAGTSGRLGVLDASECPPTFRTPPEMVQGIIAGGPTAVFRSVEGAEDDFDGGAAVVAFRGITARDVVVGIAASGRTPFVWGALGAARSRGARTVLICFNPHLRFPRGERPDVVIAPRIGPEILTGSTRLKAGTATKMILNILTTLSMVRLGKVAGNLMIDLNPANLKLRDRAIRILRELRPVDEATAREALECSGWEVKEAIEHLRRPRARGSKPRS